MYAYIDLTLMCRICVHSTYPIGCYDVHVPILFSLAIDVVYVHIM